MSTVEGKAAVEATLREVVETLAAFDRTPCERSAAEWLRGRSTIDGVEAELEDEPSWGTITWQATPPTTSTTRR